MTGILPQRLTRLESVRKQIYGRTYVEQWSINASVHYNKWADMSKEDFLPVADAFRDLQSLFMCSTCGGLLEKSPRKGSLQVAKCPCGKMNWNLRQKPATGLVVAAPVAQSGAALDRTSCPRLSYGLPGSIRGISPFW